MPGPAPKDPAARRRRNVDRAADPLTLLPAAGREGDPPPWPLAATSVEELALWAEVWSTPQAAAWETLGWSRVVARYVRLCLAAENPASSIGVAAEVRQLEDRLGLTPMAMLRLRWKVTTDELAERRDPDAGPPAPRVRSIRAVDAAAS